MALQAVSVVLSRGAPPTAFKKYLLRISLTAKNKQRPDYKVMHQHLMRAGFRRTLQARDALFYRLPIGTYFYFGSKDADRLMAYAESVVALAWPLYQIAIAEIARVSAAGLSPAAADEIEMWHRDAFKIVEGA